MLSPANRRELPRLDMTCVLVLVDIQKGFDEPYWGRRNNPEMENNVANLLHAWRASGFKIVHVRHDSTESASPLRPGQSGNEFKSEVTPLPGEHLETKQVNSAFIGTGLEEYLHQNKLSTLILCGLTSDHCVSTTTRMAANLGFTAVLPADALATFDRTGFDGKHWSAEDIHGSSLASLRGEFATIVTTADIIEALASRAVA
jgi:nicotinamidase-related amidase